MVNGINSSNFSRITGLVSGMDVDGLVKKMMDAERIPLSKVTGNRQKLQWKQEAIRTLNLDMKTFSDGIKPMRLQSAFGMFNTTSSDTTVVTGKGTSSGSDSVAQFKNISALATGASTKSDIIGGLDGSTDNKIDPTALLKDVVFTTGAPAATGSFKITALQKDGTYKTSSSISYNTATDSLNSVLARINSAGVGVTAFYDTGSDKVIMSTNATGKGTDGAALQLIDESGTFLTNTLKLGDSDGTNAKFVLNGVSTSRQTNTFTVNGIEYNLLKKTGTGASSTTTYSEGIAKTGNTVNATATLDSQAANFKNGLSGGPAYQGAFVITALQADGSMLSTGPLRYDTSIDSVATIIDKINREGIDVTASYDTNSGKVVITNNTNGAAIDGNALQISDFSGGNLLTGVFGLASAQGVDSASVNVEAKRDVDGIVTKVKDFIEKYNTMLDKLNSKHSEPTFRDYQPLTDEQKIAMKPEDIAAWEAKAKSGSLNNFSQLTETINSFRNNAYATVEGLPTGDLSKLVAIGITTDVYQSNGKLILADEDKLRAAITRTPDQVTTLFTNYSATDSTQNGIAWKLYNQANTSITKLAAIGGAGTTIYDNSTISKNIRSLNDDIAKFNLKLQRKESAYYAKFTRMETAISRLQAQNSNLLSQLGGK